MSLFEKLNNKRYDLQEKKKNEKNPFPDPWFSRRNQQAYDTFDDSDSGAPRDNENLRDVYNRNRRNNSSDTSTGNNTGNASSGGRSKGSGSRTTSTNRTNSGGGNSNNSGGGSGGGRGSNNAGSGQKSKRFKQSFGTPTGADYKTGKPVYNPSYTIDTKGKKKLGTDIDVPKGKGGGVPTDKAYEKQANRLGDRERAKKTYINPKTGKASDEGIKQYIRKNKQMSSGSNVPIDDNEVEKIYKKSKKEYEDKINQKYGGRRTTLKGTKANKFVNTGTSGAKRKAFKNFASKQGGKAFKYLKGAAARNPLVAGALAVGAGALAYNRIKKAIAGPTLTNKDFTATKPIQDRSGKNVKFTYGKDAKDKAMPYLTKDKTIKTPKGTKTIPGSLTKFKTGEYKVATKSGANYNVNDRIKNSAFEKQLQKAEKNPNKNKNKDFLKKFKNATRPT